MSEIEARAPATRGRSSVRGARGGLARGGARGGRKAPNGTSHDAFSADESLDDQGEIGEMKKKYSSELSMLKDMFPDWTDVDLVFALDEANGDLPSTVDLITEGNVSQFAEVKKPKDRARSKAADGFSTAGATDKPVFAARGGRGRGGLESTRGGRGGRGSDRARGGFRGGRGGHATTNGAPKEAHTTSVPTTESSAWDTTAAAAETGTSAWDTTATEASKENAPTNAWATIAAGQAAPAPAPAPSQPTLLPAKETAERVVAAPEVAKSSAPAEAASAPTKKSWASMFAQPKPPVALPKAVPQAQPAPKAPEPVVEPTPVETPAAEQKPTEETKEPESITKTVADAAASILPQSVLSAVGVDGQQQASEPTAETPVTESAPEPTAQTPKSATDGQEVLPATPHEPLTQENVEHLPDDSHPVSTLTAASTVGSTDPRNLTPVPGQQQPPIGRPPVGGFAISAHRAAATSGRSASFNRRVQEQQEAVVMPGHNAVDRAAVQFGSMGLNGEPGLDVDEEREEPETRQAPQHSPPTQPKASLPAAPRQAATQEPTAPEAAPTPKQAPGLGPASQQNQPQAQESVLGQSIPQEPTHLNQGQNQNYNQYAYGQGAQQDASAQQQKSYDPFGHQAQGQGRYDQYGIQPQSSHSGFGALSSAPNDYSSYYTADPQRNAYSNYYGTSAGYAPQAQQQQDAGLSQQRSASGFGASNESAFGAQAQQQTQSRYGEAPGSGHNTPNPIAASQHQNAQSAPQSQHPMHQAPSHHQQAQAQAAYNAGFPYGHPYYNSPYQQAYQNQFGYTQPASGYGGYQGKQQGGMYGSPYGSAYEQHSASPANAGAFSQNQQASMRTGSGMGSQLGGGLDDYSRSAAQSTSLNQTSGFGGVDPFARTTSGFGQNSYAQQPSMTATTQEDALKPFSESKSGPSPSLGQPGRPGSAANSVVGSSQTGVPQQQQQQQSAFGGYGGFPSQGSQYGGLGGLGGQQQPQQQQQQQQQQGMGGQGGYGSYGANAFGQYGGYGSQRGGWGQSYGAH